MGCRDQEASSKIRTWLESRESRKTPWKKVSSLAASFSIKRLTPAGKQRITESLLGFGVELLTPLDALRLQDIVQFRLSGEMDRSVDEAGESDDYSDRSPNQIIAWDAMNIDEDIQDPVEQWLRCLKSTVAGDRQLVWEASAKRGIVGIVTYSGHIRNNGVIEGWGIHHSFSRPISRENLQDHPATAWRFGSKGIKALQGSAIRLSEAETEAICEMAGGLDSTLIPQSEPDTSALVVQWTRVNGLPAEIFIENAIRDTPALWKKLKLTEQPKQQVTYKKVGRADLVSGNTVIEAKKAVTINNGPAQIERYLGHLSKILKVNAQNVRGILVQNNTRALPGVKDRLFQSPFPLELWSVYCDVNGKWKVIQVV